VPGLFDAGSVSARGYGDAALAYLRAGWQGVLPLPPAAKWPPPEGFTGHDGRWPSRDDISEWRLQLPGHNVALRLDHDVIGVDLDLYKHADARDRLEELLEDNHQNHAEAARPQTPSSTALPATWCSSSRDDGSGVYLYRVAPPASGQRWRSAPVLGCEVVQFDHRYVVVAPSTHPEGRRYYWRDHAGELAARPPEYDDLTLLPPGAAARLLEARLAGDARDPVEFDLTDGEPTERVAALRARALDACTGQDGARHDGVLAPILAIVRAAEQGEPGTRDAIREVGERFVASVAPDRPGGERQAAREFADMVTGGREKVAATAAPSPNGPAEVGAALDGYRLTDTGNASRLVKLLDGRARFVHAWGKWVVYRAGRWVIDENDALMSQKAKGVARDLFRLVPKLQFDSDKRKELFAWAMRSESAGAIAAMIRLARGAPGILVEHEQLDAEPDLLNVRNGTVDLRTGRLRAHDPADLCTKQAAVAYNPDACAPLWAACLKTWQPDAAVRDCLQLEAGAAVTGYHTETLSVHHGGGANGKSRFFGAVQHALGDYAMVPHKSLLMTARHEQHETIKADLFRARLAVASETRARDVLDDEQVKAITGGDRQRARRMREDPSYFDPTHTLVTFSNHRPRVQGRDEGIWRRLRLVPWEVTIPEGQRDRGLADKLRAEDEGVLAWCVAGARRFLKSGLTPPDAVVVATDRYRSEEDLPRRFVDEMLAFAPDRWVESSVLVEELDAWTRGLGVDAPDMREVAAILRQHGCVGKLRRVSGDRRRTWSGVALKPGDKPQ
jgi:putative DNA primase/helicase